MGRPPLPIGTYGEIKTLTRDGKIYAKGYYRHQDGKTRPHEKQGKTEAAAKRNLRAMFAEWQDVSTGTISGRSRLRAAWELYESNLEDRVEAGALTPNTLRLYRSVWSNHLEGRVAELVLTEVTTQRVERTLREISDKSRDTAKTARAVLGGLMKLAKRYEAIPHNPMHDVEGPPPARRAEPKALTPEQVAELLVKLSMDPEARSRDLPDLVLWMLATSERIGNALAQRWLRVDLDAGATDVGPNVVRVKGKGLVVQGERTASTSTKVKNRTIGLPPAAARMLRARRFDEAADIDGARLAPQYHLDVPGQGFVFPNARGTGPLDPSNLGRALERALARAGYDWVTSHVFRKTVASTLDEARMTPREISDRLGHSRTSITQDLYMRRRADSPAVTAAIEAMLTHPAPVTELRPRGGRSA